MPGKREQAGSAMPNVLQDPRDKAKAILLEV
jgi:hypothetical protein